MSQDKSGAITLIFSRSPGPISGLIRWWTTAPYSHVAIRTNEGIYEALLHGFTRRSAEVWEQQRRQSTIYEYIEVQVPSLEAAQAFLNSNIGRRYDVLGLIAYVIPYLKESRRALYCSEAARRCLSIGGIPILDEPMHPGALRWYLRGIQDGIELDN